MIGYVQTVKGEGMPIFQGSGHGDLFVEYNVVLPTTLAPSLRKSKAISDSTRRALTKSHLTELTDAFGETRSGKKDEL